VNGNDKFSVVLGTSTKGGDDLSKYGDIGKYQGTNVDVVSRPLPPLEVGGEELHAGDMRAAIDDMDVETLERKFLPSGVSGEEIINLIRSQGPIDIEDPEEELEEVSTMASGGVQGMMGKAKRDDDKENPTLIREEGMIMREEMIMEMKIRDLIRKRIDKNLKENKNKGIIYINERQKEMVEKYRVENALRECVRKLILQEKTEPVPHPNTGINQLSDLLKKIVPILSVGFKSLTTTEEQRQSYRSHVINAVINALAPIQAEDNATPEALSEEDIEIDIEDPEEEKFIDIEEPTGDDEEQEAFQTLPGQDLTGRNVAMKDFDRIERIILDSYEVLDDEKDQDLFYDYLLTNLKLYFDKFEGELAGSPDEPTTDEYEEESAAEEPVEGGEEELGAGEEELGAAEEEPLEESETAKQKRWAGWQRGLKSGDPKKKLTNDEADEFIADPVHK
jgi:hypothetical protein